LQYHIENSYSFELCATKLFLSMPRRLLQHVVNSRNILRAPVTKD